MKKIVLWSAIVLLAVGAGYLGFRFYQGNDPKLLFDKASLAYQNGSDLYEKNQFAEAKKEFDAAHHFTKAALNAIPMPSNQDSQEKQDFAGALFYLSARAVRDRYYSEYSGLSNAREPEVPDTTTGQTFRDFHRIKDVTDHRIALNYLRSASTFKPGDKTLIQDALRTELMANPLDWNYIEKLARTTLAIPGQENDPRALYLLARVRLFQPDAKGNIPAPQHRSPAQMEEALGYLDKIQSDFLVTDGVIDQVKKIADAEHEQLKKLEPLRDKLDQQKRDNVAANKADLEQLRKLEKLKKESIPLGLANLLRGLKDRPYRGARDFAKALPADARAEGVAPKILRLARVDNFPLWRTLHLHAQVHDTLFEIAKEQERVPRMEELHKLMFDPTVGIVPLARAGAIPDRRLHPWDMDGLMGVWLIGMDVKIEKIRRENDSLEPLRLTFLDFLDFCDRLEKTALPGGIRLVPRENVDDTILQALVKTQKMMSDFDSAKDWALGLEFLKPHLNQALNDALADRKDAPLRPVPQHVALYCDLTLRNAWYLHKSKQEVKKAEITSEILELLTRATEVCRDKLKLSAAEYFPLLSLQAEMTFTELHSKLTFVQPNAKKFGELVAEKKVLRERLVADLKLLRGISDEAVLKKPLSTPHALALLLEAALDERDGKLESARDKLEQVIKLDSTYEFRAHAILANIFLAMSQPDKALPSLRNIEGIYKKFDELSFPEKNWIKKFIRDTDDLSVAIIQAQYDRAYLQLRKFVQTKTNPTPSEMLEQMSREEKEAKLYLDRLPIATQQGRQARQYFISHLQRTGRIAKAEEEFKLLKIHYPGSIEILRVGLQLEASKVSASKPSAEDVAKFKKKSEEDIQMFIAGVDPAHVRIPKLFYASWLANIGLSQKALDYLQEPGNFDNTGSDDFRQVYALVLLTMNKRSEVEKLLENLPHDSRLDVIRIRILSNLEAKAQQIQGAIIRHEEEAILRIMEGENKLRSMQYEEAAQKFFYTLDYTRVKAQAQAGLTTALFSLSLENPDRTRDKVEEYLKLKPREPVLYLAYAFCCLAQDDIGKVGESWAGGKNMSSALHSWMNYSEEKSVSSLQLTAAEFNIRAEYPDRALAHVNVALQSAPDHVKARTLAITLNLQERKIPEAKTHFEKLKKALAGQPALLSKELLLLEAEIEWADFNREQAVALLEDGEQRFPKDNLFAYKLVECYQPQEKWAATDAQHSANLKKAQEILSQWQRNAPSDPFPYLAEITNWCRQGDLAKAQAKEQEFIPKIREFIKKKAASLQDEDPKRLEARRQDFLDKQELLLQIELCKHYLLGNALQLAQQRLKNLEADHPSDLRIANLLAEAYHNQHNWERADHYYQRVLAADPQQMEVANNAAWVKAFKLPSPQLQQAFDILKVARRSRLSKQEMEGDRLSLEFLDTLGLVYRKIAAEDRKLYPSLVATFVEARRRYFYDPRILVHLGYGYLGSGQDEFARKSFEEANIRLGNQNVFRLNASQLQEVMRDLEAGRQMIK